MNPYQSLDTLAYAAAFYTRAQAWINIYDEALQSIAIAALMLSIAIGIRAVWKWFKESITNDRP